MPVLCGGGRSAHAAQGARLRVVVASLRLGLAPVLLAAAALATHELRDHGRAARLVGLGATVTALGLLLVDSASIFAGGHLDLPFGESIPGFALGLRLDDAGLVVAWIAAGAAVAALLDGSLRGATTGALMICLAGAMVAALAANLLTLFVGVEIGNVGALLAITAGTRRLARGARLLLAIEHVAALGLLAAALGVQASRGTGDLAALAASPLSTGPALCWALAGVLQLLSPVIAPGQAGSRPRLAWTGVAAAPIGVIVLIRLAQASGGEVATPVGTSLAIAGVAAAIGGVVLAARHRRAPGAAGRALCLTGAGYVIAAAGVGGDAGRTGFAALALFLEVTLVSAPAWSGAVAGTAARPRRWMAALALACAGGLPVGFGTTALLLGEDAVAARGGAGMLLLTGLGIAATGAAVAAALAARHVLSGPETPGSPAADGRIRWDAVPALGISVVAAVLPGVTLGTVVAALSGGGGPATVDGGAMLGAGGAWAGGYLSLASIIAVGGVASALFLGGARAPAWGTVAAVAPAPSRRPLRAVARRAAIGLRGFRAGVTWLDQRLVSQPQLLLVVAGLAVTVLLFR